jgi:hypothetical protein
MIPDAVERNRLIDRLARFPQELADRVGTLTAAQLDRHVPEDPWSIAQIVHHCADSHMNSFIRLKLVLTETNPPLKGYDQDAWARMADERAAPIDASLTILHGLHARWVTIFRNVQDDEWLKTGEHSESGPMSVLDLLTGYADHCDEHLAQIDRILASVA